MTNVLIVEDDPMVALINRRYLESMENIHIYGPVATEEEIITVLEAHTIDLVLLDVYLPKKDGLSILKSLRGKGYYMDVIMITAANTKEEVQKAYAYGVIDYLMKPFELERFQKAIKKHLVNRQWSKEKEVLQQQDIDRTNLVIEKEALPKGLNRITLDRIVNVLKQQSEKEWTLRELAKNVEISNVTIKKYMDYLEQTAQVSVKLACGQVGRPEYRYYINR